MLIMRGKKEILASNDFTDIIHNDERQTSRKTIPFSYVYGS